MDEVVQAGPAAVAPEPDAVGVERTGSGAAGEAAPFFVERAEQLAQGGVGVAGGAPEVVPVQVGVGDWSQA